jgi:hypothetical protein
MGASTMTDKMVERNPGTYCKWTQCNGDDTELRISQSLLPNLLNDQHKRTHMDVASQHCEKHDAKSENFLVNMTCDKRWF